MKELEFSIRIDDDQSIRLGDLRGNLRQVLGPRHADRHRQAKLGAHAGPDRPGDLCRGTKQMRAPGHVGERLVDGDTLDGRREIAQDLDGGVAEPLVFGKVSADKNQVGTELPRAPPRHAASDAKGPRFVGGREHDAAADRHRPTAQARVEQLFDGRVKGVEVSVENGGYRASHHSHHNADASRDPSSGSPTPWQPTTSTSSCESDSEGRLTVFATTGSGDTTEPIIFAFYSPRM